MTEPGEFHHLRKCDVLIVGGGLVGASLAACLVRDPSLRVAVLEKSVLPPSPSAEAAHHPSYDARNTALGMGTVHLLQQLGVWASLLSGAIPIREVRISEQGGFGHAVINAKAEQVPALGYVIENQNLGQALLAHLGTFENLSWHVPAQPEQIRPLRDGVEIDLFEDGQRITYRANLLVIADGSDSPTRDKLGIASRRHDYEQSAIVTTVTTERDHQGVAWERFTAQGPLALLPQTEQRIGVTWCVARHQVRELLNVPEPAFLERLQAEIGLEATRVLGQLSRLGSRSSYPLTLTVSEEQVRSQVVVLGNAAHGLHPVAGQGLNMALRDVVALCRHVFHCRQSGQNLGQLQGLLDYLASRDTDQRKTIWFSDHLPGLFQRQGFTWRLARNSGLLLFDVLPGSKRWLARQAMGRAESSWLPRVPPLPERTC